eukprot:tig00001033_g6496.t1
MATVEELKSALKDTLEGKGVLRQIRARIRAEIFGALDDHDEPRPQLSNENLLINELIREYLEWNKYKNTLCVFLPESGQPEEQLDRRLLAHDLRIPEDSSTMQLPLLYTILAELQRGALAGRTPHAAPQPSQGAGLRSASAASLGAAERSTGVTGPQPAPVELESDSDESARGRSRRQGPGRGAPGRPAA